MATLNVETIKLIGNGVLDAKHVAVLLQADMLEQEAAVDALQMNRVCTAIMNGYVKTFVELYPDKEPDEIKLTVKVID